MPKVQSTPKRGVLDYDAMHNRALLGRTASAQFYHLPAPQDVQVRAEMTSATPTRLQHATARPELSASVWSLWRPLFGESLTEARSRRTAKFPASFFRLPRLLAKDSQETHSPLHARESLQDRQPNLQRAWSGMTAESTTNALRDVAQLTEVQHGRLRMAAAASEDGSCVHFSGNDDHSVATAVLETIDLMSSSESDEISSVPVPSVEPSLHLKRGRQEEGVLEGVSANTTAGSCKKRRP